MKKFRTLSILLIALFTGTIFLSCNDDNEEKGTCTFCGVENPLEDLVWLKQIKEEMANDIAPAKISSCLYQNDKEGFLINNCVTCPDYGENLYDCQGNCIGVIFGYGGRTYESYAIDRYSIKIIYQNFEEGE